MISSKPKIELGKRYTHYTGKRFCQVSVSLQDGTNKQFEVCVRKGPKEPVATPEQVKEVVLRKLQFEGVL